MYCERPAAFGGGVLWRSESDTDVSLILPDGCMDVIWLDGRLVVAGPDAVARTIISSIGRPAIGLRFAPGQAPRILGVNANELVGGQFELDAVMSSPLVDELAERCAEAADSHMVGHALESAFVGAAMETDDPTRTAIVSLIDAGRPIAEVADRVGLSGRQLQRRSVRLFGYGPKHLSAVLRFQRAVARGRSGASASAVAALTGYADQSHLVRDARRLAGMTFGELIGERSDQASSGA